MTQTSHGELYKLILNDIEKLCNQHKFLIEYKK